MASRREQIQEETRLRVLRLLASNPNMSSREVAKLVGISNGTAYYCINALIDKGLVKFNNFKASDQKSNYAYFLTPKGLSEKARLTIKFLELKRVEFKELKSEIDQLAAEADAQTHINSSSR